MIVSSICSNTYYYGRYWSSGRFGSRKSLFAIVADRRELVFVACPHRRVARCEKIAVLAWYIIYLVIALSSVAVDVTRANRLITLSLRRLDTHIIMIIIITWVFAVYGHIRSYIPYTHYDIVCLSVSEETVD